MTPASTTVIPNGGVGHKYGTAIQQMSVGAKPQTRKKSCHRCGNQRKNNVLCDQCPYIYCARCSEKMVEEHGPEVFQGGCPYCKKLCCCAARSSDCNKKFHCLKRCPSMFHDENQAETHKPVVVQRPKPPALAGHTSVLSSSSSSSAAAIPAMSAVAAAAAAVAAGFVGADAMTMKKKFAKMMKRSGSTTPETPGSATASPLSSKAKGAGRGGLGGGASAKSLLLGGFKETQAMTFQQYKDHKSAMFDAVAVLEGIKGTTTAHAGGGGKRKADVEAAFAKRPRPTII